MGQILHGSATTTEAVRRAIQHSIESLWVLARQYGVNPKTMLKWRGNARRSLTFRRGRESQNRRFWRSKMRRSSSLFRLAILLLPLDDCLYALAGDHSPSDAVVPTSLLATTRHQPATGGRRRQGPPRRKFKSYAIWLLSRRHRHEVRTKEGKLHLFVGIDTEPRKLAFITCSCHMSKADRRTGYRFPRSADRRDALSACIRFSPTTAGSNSQACLATATAGRRAIRCTASTRFAMSLRHRTSG